MSDELVLEARNQADGTVYYGGDHTPRVMLTPDLNADYWTYRVVLTARQAVVGFPKFMTTGIGFAVEDTDGNTNLPYTCGTEEIFRHIKKNKGDDAISDDDVRTAITMIQVAAETARAIQDEQSTRP